MCRGDTLVPGRGRLREEQTLTVPRETSGSGPAETDTGPAVVIMAGGAGTRFWPASVEARPKQFLNLLGGRSLLQQSFDRACLLAPVRRILVLTAATLVPLVREQLHDLPPEHVVGEPMRRDTAAAVCLGALLVKALFGDRVMVILTADHAIWPEEEFARTLGSAVDAASGSSSLYTVGVTPTHPSTAYGYLELGAASVGLGAVNHHEVVSFREKPDRAAAEDLVRSGRFLWNSGMFIWRADAILDRFAQYLPRHLEALGPVVERGSLPLDELELATAFSSVDAVSVDYGIMEKAADVRVAEATFAWSDIGGWEALGEHLGKDPAANRSNCRLAVLDARENVVFCSDEHELVALVGVEGLVVVRAGDRTLVVPRERAEEVKELVKSLGRGDQ